MNYFFLRSSLRTECLQGNDLCRPQALLQLFTVSVCLCTSESDLMLLLPHTCMKPLAYSSHVMQSQSEHIIKSSLTTAVETNSMQNRQEQGDRKEKERKK